MIRVVNIYHHRWLVGERRLYIGRPESWNRVRSLAPKLENLSILGNPNPLSDYRNQALREESIKKYDAYFLTRVKEPGKFRKSVGEIYHLHKAGESVILVCFCKPLQCHGDIIKSFIEEV